MIVEAVATAETHADGEARESEEQPVDGRRVSTWAA